MNDRPVEDAHGAAEAIRSLARRRGLSFWGWPAASAAFVAALPMATIVCHAARR